MGGETGNHGQQVPRYVVAVSGGVDSVVLLDVLLRHGVDRTSITVAHVDHGIRPDSAGDARFVEALASRYGVAFAGVRLELGVDASEELARRQRYKFLRSIAAQERAHVVTAHHADDVVETVAINLTRGTGWRGLSVFGARDVYRPMTVWFKHEIRAYALQHRLEWCEDATNHSDAYLRNRLRRRVEGLSESKKRGVLTLWRQQVHVREALEAAAESFASTRRYDYIMMPDDAAAEVFLATLGRSLTRPQVARALLAIKTARPGTMYDVDKKHQLRFGVSDFTLIERKK